MELKWFSAVGSGGGGGGVSAERKQPTERHGCGVDPSKRRVLWKRNTDCERHDCEIALNSGMMLADWHCWQPGHILWQQCFSCFFCFATHLWERVLHKNVCFFCFALWMESRSWTCWLSSAILILTHWMLWSSSFPLYQWLHCYTTSCPSQNICDKGVSHSYTSL